MRFRSHPVALLAALAALGCGPRAGRGVAERNTLPDLPAPADAQYELSDDEVVRIRQVIDQGYKIEGDLRRDLAFDVKRHLDLGTYRGLRHRRNLPVRGQRTHSNARTRKGPRRAIAGKKAPPSKG